MNEPIKYTVDGQDRTADVERAFTIATHYGATHVICPKHGEHIHVIRSNILGHEGAWCQICWLEMLGEPLPTTVKQIKYGEQA
jgi:hypothetical protein